MATDEAMPREPFISVIVTAYDRKRYLPLALHSVEKQVLDSSKFEVIVVKHFEDPTSDNIIRRNRWKDVVIRDPTTTTIEDLIVAVEESKGDVITFLDDDDLYAPERLAYVYAAFKSIKDLVWFHNLQYFIDEEGNTIPDNDPRARQYSGQPLYDVLLRSDDFRWIEVIARDGELHHNNSSIAIARHIAEGLRGLRGAFLDLPLTVMAGVNDGLLYHTSKKLTYYRIHNKGSVTRSPRGPISFKLTSLTLFESYGRKLRGKPFYVLLLMYLGFHHIPALERFYLSAWLLRRLPLYDLSSLGNIIKLAYWPVKDYVPYPLRISLERLNTLSKQ